MIANLDLILSQMQTNTGKTLNVFTDENPVMLVFLRHFGCTFCREALNDISAQKEEIQANGTKIIFVHMTENNIADEYFEKFNLKGIPHISDKACKYYHRFGLFKGKFNQLFGLRTWVRGFSARQHGHGGVNKALGDDFQMPGIFIIHKDEVKDQYIHKYASDRPDYKAMVNRCCNI